MEYEFGIMSKKWKMRAKTDFIAHIAMCLHIKKHIPVAIYKPEPHMIEPTKILDTDNELTKSQIEDIKEAIYSINDLENIDCSL